MFGTPGAEILQGIIADSMSSIRTNYPCLPTRIRLLVKTQHSCIELRKDPVVTLSQP